MLYYLIRISLRIFGCIYVQLTVVSTLPLRPIIVMITVIIILDSITVMKYLVYTKSEMFSNTNDHNRVGLRVLQAEPLRLRLQ